MSCRSARHTCRAARRRALWPGSVISFTAAISLWDYPCQVNLEPEFHICAGSCCQDKSEELLHSVRSVAVAATSLYPFSIYQDMARHGGDVIKPSFPPYPPLPEHTEEDRCIILIYAKPHTHCSFGECGGTRCLTENIRCHPIKPPYLTEASFCSPLIWGINLPDYLLSREFVQAFIILVLHA